MKRGLSPKRDFNPSNPHLEEDIKQLLNMPVRFERAPIVNTTPRYQIHDPVRKSLPSRTQKPIIQIEEEEQDISHNSGARRAFDIKHKRFSAIAKKQTARQWDDEEKYRKWRTEGLFRKAEVRLREKDNHVVEQIIQSRNDYYMSSLRNFKAPSHMRNSLCRAAPPEIRTQSLQSKKNYYWG
ncbi:hypothetical protein TRFO_42436 [Tritrichomonas foetus]|uniref:Uncharacterized protein n=1 Tax=Tritrichomonas foetus TaxID=1144522 RepID=A0A1J4KXJ5_9EUKA|nr:hypothetical protein TRFO_42436 [Tritrichomonas foetus]|eukprot:OHT15608.1 hypothetical protein TRFO_42436 [Tritrichomonas foetus]